MIDIDASVNTESFQHSDYLCMLNESVAHANLPINRVLEACLGLLIWDSVCFLSQSVDHEPHMLLVIPHKELRHPWASLHCIGSCSKRRAVYVPDQLGTAVRLLGLCLQAQFRVVTNLVSFVFIITDCLSPFSLIAFSNYQVTPDPSAKQEKFDLVFSKLYKR